MANNILSLVENKIHETKIFLESIITENLNIDETTNLIILEEDVIDSTILHKEELVSFILKHYSLSVLTGEYITEINIIQKLDNIENNIKELLSITNDLSTNIQSHIFELVSSIVIISEIYKDFTNNIINKYSEHKVDYIFSYNKKLKKELENTNSSEVKYKSEYFFNILRITSIDHFPSNDDNFLMDLYYLEDFFEKNKNFLNREIALIILTKINFLKHKWKERRFQDYPLHSNYFEDGQQKFIEDFETDNPKLNQWIEIINTQYELYSSNWKMIISNRVKFNLNSNCNLSDLKVTELHQLIKYYKDVKPNLNKLKKITQAFKDKRNIYDLQNFYDKHSLDLCLNYALNNEFSKYIEDEKSIKNIKKYYHEIQNDLCGKISNYFIQFKYLTKISELITPLLTNENKSDFIKKYEELIEESKQDLTSYFENKEWSIKNFNYIFSLPFEESLVNFQVDDEEYKIFFASSFVLPPSIKNIEEGHTKVKDDFKRITTYIDFSKYFSHEINEIKGINKELDKKDFKSIEIISIFTAIITFVLSSIPAYNFINSVWESLLFMLTLSTSLSLFITLILFSTRELYKKWYAYAMVIILLTLCFFGFKNLLQYERNENKLVENKENITKVK